MRRHPETQPGDLDQRVSIVRFTEAVDQYGNPITNETTVGTVWAHVEPVRGQERVIADRQRGTQTMRFTARNQGDWATVTPADVLRWDGDDYNVRSAPNAGRALYRIVEAERGVES
jgi:SPP1 family predicted phage head-tail adaptor